MSWKGSATSASEEITDNLLMLQAEAQEKARLVRNCHRCINTWRDSDIDGKATRCDCYKDWKSAMITLRVAVKKAKETRDEWETDEMFDFHKVNTRSLDNCVDPEKFKTLSCIIGDNLFMGLEPPYMVRFNEIHTAWREREANA